jgi:hypothetical protein
LLNDQHLDQEKQFTTYSNLWTSEELRVLCAV